MPENKFGFIDPQSGEIVSTPPHKEATDLSVEKEESQIELKRQIKDCLYRELYRVALRRTFENEHGDYGQISWWRDPNAFRTFVLALKQFIPDIAQAIEEDIKKIFTFFNSKDTSHGDKDAKSDILCGIQGLTSLDPQINNLLPELEIYKKKYPPRGYVLRRQTDCDSREPLALLILKSLNLFDDWTRKQIPMSIKDLHLSTYNETQQQAQKEVLIQELVSLPQEALPFYAQILLYLPEPVEGEANPYSGLGSILVNKFIEFIDNLPPLPNGLSKEQKIHLTQEQQQKIEMIVWAMGHIADESSIGSINDLIKQKRKLLSKKQINALKQLFIKLINRINVPQSALSRARPSNIPIVGGQSISSASGVSHDPDVSVTTEPADQASRMTEEIKEDESENLAI